MMAKKTTRQTKRQRLAQNRAKAMSHEHRAKALRIWSERVASPSEVAKELGLDVSKLAYHVEVLRDLECIEEVGKERVRGAVKTYYRAVELPIVHTDEWEEVPQERRRGLAAEFFQAVIDEGPPALEAGSVGQDGKFWVGPMPVTVDEQGLEELVALYDEVAERVADVKADFLDRQAKGEAGDPVDVVAMHACFRTAKKLTNRVFDKRSTG